MTVFEEYTGVYVIADCFDGQARKVTYELIGQARLIADQLNEEVHTLILGAQVGAQAQSLIEYGSDHVHVFEHSLLARYSTDGYTKVITDFFSQNKPNVILIGATNDGRDLAPRISGRMKNGVVADCTILTVSQSDGLVEWTRPALGGNILAEIICPEHRPQMGSVRPNVFKMPDRVAGRAGQIHQETVTLADSDIRNRFVEMIKVDMNDVNIEEAEIIVAGGRGMGSPANFKVLEELADVLGGVLGVTRPIVEKGWYPLSRQIGQTGKTIAPKIYLAFGISGAIQHTAGITGSETIVAINTDPEAAIFKVCDYGIVGDAVEVAKEMIGKFKSAKG
ncbi:electron transfer flavoprotein subunit alpha/FixB family protein [Veillonella sp. R32]|uniref:electron transfer flavoprotein subunit alpha/FixB family protein n=1 Tax=Veillonella sp. R32 TaxID=2021312 RepID=UPI00138A4324|nr:electron transfer flavoprotein subunit alpha/FixB family protein [Veillonella sp. R32]KAF1683591.1 electron transfer flavoprotein subunit alpha [Veillonella sp. R32]